jgi:hypothetical protein
MGLADREGEALMAGAVRPPTDPNGVTGVLSTWLAHGHQSRVRARLWRHLSVLASLPFGMTTKGRKIHRLLSPTIDSAAMSYSSRDTPQRIEHVSANGHDRRQDSCGKTNR